MAEGTVDNNDPYYGEEEYYDPALLPPPESDFDYPIEPVDPSLIESVYRRQVVEFNGFVKPGTIIVDPKAHFLYQVLGNRQAMRYGVGVGRDGFAWSGKAEIRMKRRWPRWVPPKEMVARDKRARKWANGQPGGPDNPLGRAGPVFVFGRQGHALPDSWDERAGIHRKVGLFRLRAHAERGCGRAVRAGCDWNQGHCARGVGFKFCPSLKAIRGIDPPVRLALQLRRTRSTHCLSRGAPRVAHLGEAWCPEEDSNLHDFHR